jgi:hypothetical protein
MKLKIISIILLSVSLSQHLMCQELKTYNSIDGKFVYQYYENSDFERIYNGSYKELYENCNIEGKFIENKKNGYWYYFKKHNYNSKINDGYFNREISGNYENDKKNGIWTYKEGYDYKSKKFRSIIKLKFLNDTIIGDIELDNYSNSSGEFGYRGKLDSLGNFTGIWKQKHNDNQEIIYEFHKNFVIKMLRRNLVTGEIYEKYLPNREEIISKIDEIILNNLKLLKGESYANGYFRGKDKYRYEESNLGYQLLGKFISEIINPTVEGNIKSQKNNIINTSFFYKSPIYLLVREKEDYGFKRFLNSE